MKLFEGLLLLFTATSAAAQGLFPITLSIDVSTLVWTNSSQFKGSGCSASSPLATYSLPIYAPVLLNDSWTSIAARYNISTVDQLLLFNNILTSDIISSTGDFLLQPSPNTFVVVNSLPSIAPECTCPPAYPQLSDDTSLCYDAAMVVSRPRILSTATLPSYITGSITAGYWEPNRTALVSDALLDLQVQNEISQLDMYFSRNSGLPARIEVFTSNLRNSPNWNNSSSISLDARYSVFSNVQYSQDSSTWTKTLTFVSAANLAACSVTTPPCAQLVPGYTTSGVLASNWVGSLLKIRFFRDPAQTKPLQVCTF